MRTERSQADRTVIILLTHSCFKPSTSPIFTPTTRLSQTRYTIFRVFLALETLMMMTSKAYEQEPTRSSQRLPKHLVGHHLRTGGELCGRRFRGRRTGVTGASAFQLQRPTAFLEQCYRYPTQGVRSDRAWFLDTAHSRHQLFNSLRI